MQLHAGCSWKYLWVWIIFGVYYNRYYKRYITFITVVYLILHIHFNPGRTRFWLSEEGHNQIYDAEYKALLKDDSVHMSFRWATRQNEEWMRNKMIFGFLCITFSIFISFPVTFHRITRRKNLPRKGYEKETNVGKTNLENQHENE